MVGEFEKALTPEVRAAGRGPRASVRAARDARVDRREGDRAGRTSGRWWPRCTPTGCASAWACSAIPTVIYALEQAGRYDGNIRTGDLAIDSPYNTYRYAGLPPGPIASPGRASLAAAAAPAAAPYLYFVSRNDGSHAFAATLEEHNRNVNQYQVQYFRERRAEAARQR